MSSPTMSRQRQLKWIPVDRVVPNENNPRAKQHFTKDELLSLRESIHEHGVLEPVLVQPYRDGPREDRYLLIEGERRYSVAKDLGLREMPAVVGAKLDDYEQLLVMYHMHTQRRGWEKAEELRTIKEIMQHNGRHTEEEMAKKLGMSLATFKDRIRVLSMGDQVLTDIARDKIDYSSALRIVQVTKTLTKKRPAVVQKMGGNKEVERKLLKKAKERGGISQELVEAKKDLTDVNTVPDQAVERYIEDPALTIRNLRKEQRSLEERRQAEELAKYLRRVEREISSFDADLEAIPNLRQLRAALGSLMDAAQDLETRVVAALLEDGE